MATARRTTRLYLRLALSLLLGAALVATTAVPGFAQPDNNELPDPGARPAPAGEVPLPDGSFARPPTADETLDGPLAAEIAEIQIDISTRTTELQSVEPAVGPAEQDLTQAEVAWRTANQARMAAQAAFDELVADSYRGAAALPADLFIPELRGLSAHAHVLPVEAPLGAAAAARELVASRAAEQEAASWFETARVTQQDLAQRQLTLEAELADLTAELEALQERNAELLAEAERAREAAAQNQDFPVSQPVAGFRAGEAAVAAVNFALSQLGKPYLWGAEGPDRYDCSGLVFASYNHARARFGATTVPVLPRVAADQYFGTQDRLVSRSATVARRGLLPGDLVFFASGLSWQSVHHVGMYVGNGYMVHAPNRNEVVKVSPVWWNRFFAATRVVEAVRVSPDPGGGGTPDPEPGPPPPSSGGGGVIRPTPPDPTTPGPGTTTPPPATTSPPLLVPEVVGLDEVVAIDQIEAEGLEWAIGEPLVSGDCAPGTVAVLDPPAGTRVEPGTVVVYRMCQAPPPDPTTPPPSPSPEETPSESPTPTPGESSATSPSAPPA